MADDIDELAIVLTARFDQLEAGLKTALDKVNEFGDKANQAGTNATPSFLELAAKVGLTYEALKSFIEASIEAAAETESLNVALFNTAGNLGINSDALQAQKKAIEDAGFTERDSIEILNKFALAHIDTKYAVDLAKVSMDFADATGKDYGETLNALGKAILTGNVRALREFGITLHDVTKAHLELANEHHKLVGELSETEIRTANLNLIMEHAKDVAGDHAAVMKTAGGEIKQFRVEAETAAESIGKIFTPSLGGLLSVVNKLLDGFNKLSENEWFKKSEQWMTKAGLFLAGGPGLASLFKVDDSTSFSAADISKAGALGGANPPGSPSSSAGDDNKEKKLKEEQDLIKQVRAMREQMASELASTMAQTFTGMVNIFGDSTINMGKLWENMVNKMIEKVIETGLMDIFNVLTGGTGGKLAGLFGFDNPQNDAMAYASGGKWFMDALSNFSKGYVDQAVSPGAAPTMAAAAMGGGGGGVTNIHVSMPSMLNTHSPTDRRKAAIEVGNLLKNELGVF